MTALAEWSGEQYALCEVPEQALPGRRFAVSQTPAHDMWPGFAADEPTPVLDLSIFLAADRALCHVADGFGVQVADPGQVLAHMIKRPDLAATLPVAADLVRRELGREATLCLQVFTSPEDSPEDEAILTLAVRLPQYPPDTMERIRRVREQYYEELPVGASHWVLITTDFR